MKINKKLTVRLIVIFVIVIGISIVLFNRGIDFYEINQILNEIKNMTRDLIESAGPFAAIVFIMIFSVKTLFIIFPYSLLVILGGNIFGPLYGFLYSVAGIFFSSTLAFFLSRLLGKDVIYKLLKNRAVKFDGKVENHGLKIIFFMRLSAIFPFDALSYVSGLTKIKYRHFIVGTILGSAFETFSLNYLGDNISDPLSKNFIIAIVLVVIAIGTPLIVRKIKSSKKNNAR